MLGYLAGEWQRDHPGIPHDWYTDPSRRIERADINGTSAVGGYAWFGRWDHDGLSYEQRGVLPRHHLARACELLEAGRESEVWDLLVPFEDGEDGMEVRRG